MYSLKGEQYSKLLGRTVWGKCRKQCVFSSCCFILFLHWTHRADNSNGNENASMPITSRRWEQFAPIFAQCSISSAPNTAETEVIRETDLALLSLYLKYNVCMVYAYSLPLIKVLVLENLTQVQERLTPASSFVSFSCLTVGRKNNLPPLVKAVDLPHYTLDKDLVLIHGCNTTHNK